MNAKYENIEGTILEICSNGITSSINAVKGGANRIELCANLQVGGTTPSIGTIDLVSQLSNIETRVMIRPRSGDFLYSKEEFEVMKRDIEYCKRMRIEGVVFGMLLANGKLDIKKIKILMKLAYPMRVTFHRAFDMCENQFLAIKQLIDLGVDTVLTSGGQNKAINGLRQIEHLSKIANNHIEIMVGSGVRPDNVQSFFDIGIRAFHFSALMNQGTKMYYYNDNISMGNNTQISEYDNQYSDVKLIKEMKSTLDKLSIT